MFANADCMKHSHLKLSTTPCPDGAVDSFKRVFRAVWLNLNALFCAVLAIS